MEIKVNRQYKDRLFKFIFGRKENKDLTLSLFNAINRTSYTDTSQLEFTTIEDAIYISRRNDLSFMIC